MKEMFKKRNISHTLRDGSVIAQLIKIMIYRLSTFTYYGAHIWNILPNDLKTCTTINI